MEANYAHVRKGKEHYPDLCLGYEYHYWRQQYHDPGLMYISRRIYEDIRSLKIMGLDGLVEDENALRREIYGMICADVTTGLAKRTTQLLEAES